MNPKQRALGSPCGRGSTRHRVTVCRAQTASDNPTSGPLCFREARGLRPVARCCF
jgi:hypothetical protein